VLRDLGEQSEHFVGTQLAAYEAIAHPVDAVEPACRTAEIAAVSQLKVDSLRVVADAAVVAAQRGDIIRKTPIPLHEDKQKGDMAPTSVSVVIPTFRRPELLRRCLHSLRHQTLPAEAYEIVVVDNGPDDDTARTVELFAAAFASRPDASSSVGPGPSVRYIVEEKRGLSYAKNAGATAAVGEIVAYLDDDALASPDWLRCVVAGFTEVEPPPYVVGGPVYPLLAGRRPAWFQDRYETASWGDHPRLLERGEYFYGANVAFRRDLLLRAGGFDPALGMKGTTLGFAEDAEVFERLRAATDGPLVSLYLPKAYVLHLIPEERVSPGYRLKRYFMIGQTKAVRDLRNPASRRWQVIGRATWRFARAVVAAIPRDHFPRHYASWAYEQGTYCALALGYLAGALGFRATVQRTH